MATGEDLELEFAMTYVVRTSNPLDPTTGLDWMGMSDDGFWRPHVRAQFLTDDDAIVLMAYTGLVQQTVRFAKAAEADEPTE